MGLVRLSTQFHKWLALFVGLQVLFWVGGGLVMTVLPIEKVRSEHRVRTVSPQALSASEMTQLPQLAAGQALAKAELKSTPRGALWILTPIDGKPVTLSADTGQPLPPMTSAQAAGAAAAAYQGPGQVARVEYLVSAPQEANREGPIWRIDFSDKEKTSFYLSPETGEIVSRRSAVWRFYDAFWRLHIMDWKNGEDFNHPLIIVTTLLTLIIVITGFVLLWVRLARDFRVWTSRKQRR